MYSNYVEFIHYTQSLMVDHSCGTFHIIMLCTFFMECVGVLMFWQVWLYQKIRQHQNHFGTLGYIPPGSREGYLYKGKDIYVFEVQFQGIRLVIRHKVCFVLFVCLVVWKHGGVQYKTKGEKRGF